MLIEQIDNKRLLIMLESEDMKSLELTYDKISWQNQKFKILIARLLALAKFETGFSIGDRRLSIETIPQGAGCVIIFTLFPESKIKINGTLEAVPEVKKPKPLIYKLASFDDLTVLCEKMSRIKRRRIKSSSVVRSDKSYFIIIYPNGDLPTAVSVLLSEYGTDVGFSKSALSYLYEFGTVIKEKNAVSYISELVK